MAYVFVRRIKSGGKEPVLIEKAISENGEYLAESDEADGYSKVTVNVPSQVNKLAQVADKSITEITADDLVGATKIELNVFMSCDSLVSVVIPDNVLEIGNLAFRYCKALKTIVIGNGVTKIGQQVFYGCTGALTIEVGTGVTSIMDSAFNGCTNLQSITIRAIEPPTLPNSNPLLNTNYCPIYVPAASVEAYKTATNWSAHANRIQAIPA